jgi:hypothetical protein
MLIVTEYLELWTTPMLVLPLLQAQVDPFSPWLLHVGLPSES